MKNLFTYNNNKFFFSKVENIINNILICLIVLFPIVLLSGPFLPDLIIVLTSIYFIYLTIKKNNFVKLFNTLLIKFLGIFWIYLIISSFFSDHIIFSLRSSLFYLRFIIFSCFICFVLDSYPNFKKYFLISIIFAFVFVQIDSIYQFYNNKDIFGFSKPNLRLTGPFKDRQIVGSYLSRLLPLLIFIYLVLKKNINYKLNLFIFSTALVVLLSGERTSFFMITFFIFSYVFIYYNLKNLILFFLLYFVVFFGLILSTNDVNERFYKQTLEGFAIKKYTKTDGIDNYFDLKPKKGFYLYSRAHEVHYATSTKMFLDNKIFGVGPNMFRKKCRENKFFIEESSCTTHPHNTALQILAETGLLGFSFYALILFYLIFKIVCVCKNKIKFYKITEKEKNEFILHISFIINTFLIVLPSGNFFNNYLNAIIFLPLGFYMNYINNHE